MEEVGAAAPKPQLISEILAEHELPLLVQARSGRILLLNRSVRIPYIICQHLENEASDDNYFLIPLDNKALYGAVSHEDEVTTPHGCIQDAMRDKSGGVMRILVSSTLPVKRYDDKRSGINEVLIPGDIITVGSKDLSDQCEEMRASSTGCCFSGSSGDNPSDMLCVRAEKHIHIDRFYPAALYVIQDQAKGKLQMGHAHTLQDIAQSQNLPMTIASLYIKQSTRDTLQLPRVFRLLKVISDRVVIAYTLDHNYSPTANDCIDISSYSADLFTIAGSHRVNMEDIREHKATISIRKASPGETVSNQDFRQLLRQSVHLPPKLPSRPVTLRITPARPLSLTPMGQTYAETKPTRKRRPKSTSFEMKDTTLSVYAGEAYEDRPAIPAKGDLTLIEEPGIKASQTVRLPTRRKQSILRRLTMTFKSKPVKRQSMTTLLDAFKDQDTKETLKKPKPPSNLRKLEISRPILPDDVLETGIDNLAADYHSSVTITTGSHTNSHIGSHDTGSHGDSIHIEPDPDHYAVLESPITRNSHSTSSSNETHYASAMKSLDDALANEESASEAVVSEEASSDTDVTVHFNNTAMSNRGERKYSSNNNDYMVPVSPGLSETSRLGFTIFKVT